MDLGQVSGKYTYRYRKQLKVNEVVLIRDDRDLY